jgi:phosphatidylglycerol---prolipoprotein diacylglyceryl transferase
MLRHFFFIPLESWTPYRALLLLAFVLGVSFVIARLAVARVRPWRAFIVCLAVVLGALLGSRWLPWILAGAPGYDAAPALPLFVLGGVFVGALSAVVAARLARLPIGATLDALAIAFALGLGIVRVGCFLTGCDYGAPATGSWTGLAYPAWTHPGVAWSAPAHLDHVGRGLIDSDAVTSLRVLPVQLYESLFGLALFTWLVHPSSLRRPGSVALRLIAGYGVARFVLELIRGDADRGLDALSSGLTASQLVSGGAFLIAFSLIVLRDRLNRAPARQE